MCYAVLCWCVGVTTCGASSLPPKSSSSSSSSRRRGRWTSSLLRRRHRDFVTSNAGLGEGASDAERNTSDERNSDDDDNNVAYDIVVLFSRREKEQYICRTLRSIIHRARYTGLYVSFSGLRDDELASMRIMCPELESLPTAVFSSEQAADIDTIVRHIGQLMDTNVINTMETADGPVKLTLNKAENNVPQWYTMKNAIHIAAPDAARRHLIVMEDDIVLSEDFDELLRAAIVEAEATSDAFAISMYIGDSDSVQVSEDGELVRLLDQNGEAASIDPRWKTLTRSSSVINWIVDRLQYNTYVINLVTRSTLARMVASRIIDNRVHAAPRDRGSRPLLVDKYLWGQQAVLYSRGIVDDFRAYFEACEEETISTLRHATSKTQSLDGNDDHDGRTHEQMQMCIKPIDIFNAEFMRHRSTYSPFYTTMDSLVQHIGLSSTIQRGDGRANKLFHYNVALGTVSEEYDETDAMVVRESKRLLLQFVADDECDGAASDREEHTQTLSRAIL